MSFGLAFAAVEEVLLNVFEDGEPGAAGSVRDSLSAGTSGALLDSDA